MDKNTIRVVEACEWTRTPSGFAEVCEWIRTSPRLLRHVNG